MDINYPITGDPGVPCSRGENFNHNQTRRSKHSLRGGLDGRITLGLVAVAVALLIWGDFYYAPPPLKVGAKPSSVGMGYKVMVINSGKQPLHNVRMYAGFGTDNCRVGQIASRLDPGESTVVGWLELPFVLNPGEYKISASGYRGYRTFTIP